MDAGKQCLGKKPGKEGKKVIRRTSRKLILEEKKDRNRKKKTSIYYMLEMNEKRRGKVASKRKGIQQNQINVFWKA